MDNLTPPLSKESASSAVVAVGEAAKKAGHHHHHWGRHHSWGNHMGRSWTRCGFLAAGAFIAVPTFGGYLNSVYAAAKDKEDPWITTLKTPSWMLPQQMFAPIWNACYASMGIASFIVWRHGGGFGGKAKLPLILYGSQLALNLSWVPVFYTSKSMKLGALISFAATIAATATTVSFHSVKPTAGFIMVPYLLWMFYEAAISYSLCSLNKNKKDE